MCLGRRQNIKRHKIKPQENSKGRLFYLEEVLLSMAVCFIGVLWGLAKP